MSDDVAQEFIWDQRPMTEDIEFADDLRELQKLLQAIVFVKKDWEKQKRNPTPRIINLDSDHQTHLNEFREQLRERENIEKIVEQLHETGVRDAHVSQLPWKNVDEAWLALCKEQTEQKLARLESSFRDHLVICLKKHESNRQRFSKIARYVPFYHDIHE